MLQIPFSANLEIITLEPDLRKALILNRTIESKNTHRANRRKLQELMVRIKGLGEI